MTGIESLSSGTALLTAAQTAQQFASQQPKKPEKTARLSFADALRKSEKEARLVEEGLPAELAGMTEEEAVVFLKDAVDVAADGLRFHQSLENLANYRKKISQFLKYISRNNYEVISKRRLLQKINGQRRTDTVRQIHIINESLDRLMTDTIFNQRRKLNLLARIGEINGLIVDLLQ